MLTALAAKRSGLPRSARVLPAWSMSRRRRRIGWLRRSRRGWNRKASRSIRTDGAFVACARSDAVAVVDLVGGVVVAEVAVGREPMDVAFDDATDRLFTADLLAETVSVVDASTLRLVASMPVGLYPLQVGRAL